MSYEDTDEDTDADGQSSGFRNEVYREVVETLMRLGDRRCESLAEDDNARGVTIDILAGMESALAATYLASCQVTPDLDEDGCERNRESLTDAISEAIARWSSERKHLFPAMEGK